MKTVPDDRTLDAFELSIVCCPSGTVFILDEWRSRHPGTDQEFRKSLIDLTESGYLTILYRSGSDDWSDTLSIYHGVEASDIHVAFRRT